MKKLNKLLTITLAVVLFAACTQDNPPLPPEGQVEVRFKLPGMYNAVNTTKVKTVRASDYFFSNEELHNLPEGETVWVLISKVIIVNNNDTIFEELPPKPYRVLSAVAGYQSLYPCEMNKVERGDSIVYTTNAANSDMPLMLDKGFTYRFHMVAPAKELVYYTGGSDRGEYAIWVDNNTYLYANDDRYETTKSINHYYTINLTDPTNVVEFALNPLLHQTARMNVIIHPGDGVHDLDILVMGFELGGLSTGPKRWQPNEVNSLDPRHALNRGRASRAEYYKDEDGSMHWEMGILPVNLSSGPLSLLMNLRINLNTTQCLIMLQPDEPLVHGRSYLLEYNMHLQDGIVVFTFTNQGWQTDVIW